MSRYEVTFYVNAGVGADRDGIQAIQPYAAYDVTANEWTVLPNPNPHPPFNPSWENVVERDHQDALAVIDEYSKTLNEIRSATNSAHRANAESRLKHIMDLASGMYEQIHTGRKAAFSPTGAGYSDFGNYRWQAGKKTGAVHALRRISEYVDAANEQNIQETYGMELPDSRTLIRRSATYRSIR